MEATAHWLPIVSKRIQSIEKTFPNTFWCVVYEKTQKIKRSFMNMKRLSFLFDFFDFNWIPPTDARKMRAPHLRTPALTELTVVPRHHPLVESLEVK